MYTWQLMGLEDVAATELYFDSMARNYPKMFDYSLPAENIVNGFWDHGGAFLLRETSEIKGLLGYYNGTPQITENEITCPDSQTLYIMSWHIDKDIRGKYAKQVRPILAEHAIKQGFEKIQFKALKNRTKLNHYYETIAERILETTNFQNYPSYLYEVKLGEWL